MKPRVIFILCAATFAAAPLLHAAGIVSVSQNHRAFGVAALTLHRGDTIHFTNEDVFNHQAFIKTPEFAFESPEQPPGGTVDILFSKAGLFDVQCGIHPRMHLSVKVE